MVELRIYEGEGPLSALEDITFSYDANFFLFATLEAARNIAHGRVQQPSTPLVPVLTGMPVSGMAYLDRPTEAGYFIFPDLSVRHEGKYRLSFNLYEETKKQGDLDVDPSEQKPKAINGQDADGASFDWRLEVKSDPFVVYSAKKFPGLAESTALSRTVAEQGCRVRIRRDVRMRRREGKNIGDFEETNEDEYSRAGRPSEQSQQPYRERSNSANSDDGRAPYADSQRRMSGDYPPQSYSYTPSPVAGHAAPPPTGGHLVFGGNSAGSQYQAPPPHFAQPAPPPPPTQPYQSNPSSFHQPTPSQYGAPPPAPTHNGYPYDRQYPKSAFPANPPREQRELESEYRRASITYAPLHGPQPGSYIPVDPNYNRLPYHGYSQRPHSPSLHTSVDLPPLQMPPMESKYDHVSSSPGPLSSVNRIQPPLPNPSYERGHQDRPFTYPGPLVAAPHAEPERNGKRTYDAVFNSASNNEPLFNGMRPTSSHHQGMFDDDDDDEPEIKMAYKRADGSRFMRELPTLTPG